MGLADQPVHLEVLSEVVPRPTGRHCCSCMDSGTGRGASRRTGRPRPPSAGTSYAMSLRGHGGSGGQTRWGAPHCATTHDVLQVISSLDQPPVLVAHSLGTLVAQRVLQRYPARAGVLLTPIPAGGIPATMVQVLRSKPVDFTARCWAAPCG